MKQFTTFNEIMEDLNSITPLEKDLSHEQDIDIVMTLIVRVMVNIQKSADYKFSEEEMIEYGNALKKLGCTNYENANKCFKSDTRTVKNSLTIRNNIEFPLSALTQLIDSNGHTFLRSLDRMTGGGKYSWVAEWLDTQGIKYEYIDDFVNNSKFYNEEGKKYIYPQLQQQWETAVRIRLTDLYKGMDLQEALDFMNAIDSGKSLASVVNMFNRQDYSGTIYNVVKSLVLDFSKRGPDFCLAMEENIKPEREKILEEKRERNKKFAKEIAAQTVKQTNQDEFER